MCVVSLLDPGVAPSRSAPVVFAKLQAVTVARQKCNKHYSRQQQTKTPTNRTTKPSYHSDARASSLMVCAANGGVDSVHVVAAESGLAAPAVEADVRVAG